MSESSSSNNGESYSAPVRKYMPGPSYSESPSSESSSNYSSPSYSPPVTSDNSNNNSNNLNIAKKILKNLETKLMSAAAAQNVDIPTRQAVKEKLRLLAVDNEDTIINIPTYTTILGCYERVYNTLSESQKELAVNNLLFSTLHDLIIDEKKNSSKIKYW
jgi:hypothetical protein